MGRWHEACRSHHNTHGPSTVGSIRGWDGWNPQKRGRGESPRKGTQLFLLVNVSDLLPPASISWPFFTCNPLCQALCWNRNAPKETVLVGESRSVYAYIRQLVINVVQDVHNTCNRILEDREGGPLAWKSKKKKKRKKLHNRGDIEEPEGKGGCSYAEMRQRAF